MSIAARFRIQRPGFCLDVDLDLPGTGVTAVFGPSGCGKTTLLRAFAGLERGPQGWLKVGQQVWQSDREFLPTHRRALGYVFQEASLFDHLSVRDNLAYGERRVPRAERRLSLDAAVELLGIGGLLKRRPASLSGGERQRVAIARALAASPRLLLMDEPLAALDLRRKREILPYLDSLHRELRIPVIYVSHSVGEVARLADHLVLLDEGRVIASTDTIDAFTRTDLPLALSDRAAAIVETRVDAHDETYGLSYLGFDGGRFCVTRRDLPLGATTRLRVFARDVSLTLEAQTGTSMLNILACQVEETIEQAPGQVLVILRVGATRLMARITRKSAADLGIAAGQRLYAQVKSVALLS